MGQLSCVTLNVYYKYLATDMNVVSSITGGLIALAIGGLIVRYARHNTWSNTNRKSQRKSQLVTELTRSAVIELIRAMAEQYGYTIDEETNNSMILSDQPSGTSGGFFYPISMKKSGRSTTQIVVGIKSRFMQFGPVVRREHEKIIDQINTAINNPGLRIRKYQKKGVSTTTIKTQPLSKKQTPKRKPSKGQKPPDTRIRKGLAIIDQLLAEISSTPEDPYLEELRNTCVMLKRYSDEGSLALTDIEPNEDPGQIGYMFADGSFEEYPKINALVEKLLDIIHPLS